MGKYFVNIMSDLCFNQVNIEHGIIKAQHTMNHGLSWLSSLHTVGLRGEVGGPRRLYVSKLLRGLHPSVQNHSTGQCLFKICFGKMHHNKGKD